MAKAIVVAALGGMLSGHWVRNGWWALLLLIGIVSTEVTVETVHHHWTPAHDVAAFAVLDWVGSMAVLLGEALTV